MVFLEIIYLIHSYAFKKNNINIKYFWNGWEINPLKFLTRKKNALALQLKVSADYDCIPKMSSCILYLNWFWRLFFFLQFNETYSWIVGKSFLKTTNKISYCIYTNKVGNKLVYLSADPLNFYFIFFLSMNINHSI